MRSIVGVLLDPESVVVCLTDSLLSSCEELQSHILRSDIFSVPMQWKLAKIQMQGLQSETLNLTFLAHSGYWEIASLIYQLPMSVLTRAFVQHSVL